MAFDLKGKSLLTLKDFSKKDIDYLLYLAMELKNTKNSDSFEKKLNGKNIALLFEKTSTRTRCAFVTAAFNEGAHAEFLGKNDIQFGKKESVSDTARVLGRMFDGIGFRGFKQETVEILAKYSGIPVWNCLTDPYHPTQALADFMTIQEKFGFLKSVKLAYIGDGRNNVANSLMIGASKIGMDIRIIAPRVLFPKNELVEECKEFASGSGANIILTESIEEGVKGCKVIYTDIWSSMGEEDKIEERIELLKPYQVNMDMINLVENDNVIFMHCLPSFHNLETEIAQKYPNICEVTDEVFEDRHSRVFDQAENRLWTIQAIMVASLT